MLLHTVPYRSRNRSKPPLTLIYLYILGRLYVVGVVAEVVSVIDTAVEIKVPSKPDQLTYEGRSPFIRRSVIHIMHGTDYNEHCQQSIYCYDQLIHIPSPRYICPDTHISFVSPIYPSRHPYILPVTRISFLSPIYPSCHPYILPVTRISFLSPIYPSCHP